MKLVNINVINASVVFFFLEHSSIKSALLLAGRAGPSQNAETAYALEGSGVWAKILTIWREGGGTVET